jgi:hypothetical protein
MNEIDEYVPSGMIWLTDSKQLCLRYDRVHGLIRDLSDHSLVRSKLLPGIFF